MKTPLLPSTITIILAITLLLLMPPQLPQANAQSTTKTITVPNDYPTIQAAINYANNGDIINIKAGSYHENIIVNRTVSLLGENQKNTLLYANQTTNAIEITADNTTISGLTIQNTNPNQTPYTSNGINIASNHNTITNNTITANSNHGINLINSNDNNIEDNNVTTNYWNGIVLQNSDGNNIHNNDINQNTLNNNGVGILLQDGSDFNTIEKNTITKNDGGIGLAVAYSSNGCNDNILKNNTISENTHDGIFIYDFCLRNRIELNNVTQNGGGIHLSNADKNVIAGNDISRNSYGGIGFENASLNVFFHNNLVENTPQVWYFSNGDAWDNGYPSGGNYWSDYTGIDANQNGIGDNPYTIDTNNQDRYPLMEPYHEPETTYRLIDFSDTFRNSDGAALYVRPSFFMLSFPNGTASPPLSVGTYLMQTGTTVITSVIWQSSEVSPDVPFAFDAADGYPVVKCSVYQLTIDPVFYDMTQNQTTALKPKSWVINFPNGTTQEVSSAGTYAQAQTGNYEIGKINLTKTEIASPKVSTWLSSNTVWSPEIRVFSLGGNLTFAFDSNSDITQLNYNLTSQILSFTATGANGTSGFTKITFSNNLANNPFEVIVRVDGIQIGFFPTWVDEFWLLEFHYKHSSHIITVDFNTNRPVVLEFPSIVILGALLLFISVVAVFLRKHNLGKCLKLPVTLKVLSFFI